MDGEIRRLLQELLAALEKPDSPLRAIFEKAADGGWQADVPEIAGCSVKGRTIAEARQRLKVRLVEQVAEIEEPVTFEEEISW